MTHKLKVLGPALMAVLVASAIAASAAQAEGTFTGFETPGGVPTHVHTLFHGTSEGVQTFTTLASIATECYHAEFEGTALTGTSQALTMSAKYFGTKTETFAAHCETSETWKTHVNMEGCDYVFHPGIEVEPTKYKGTVNVECPSEKEIDIKITKLGSEETKCTVKVPAQKGLGPVYYYNKKAEKPTDVTVETEAKEITFTTEGGLLNCGVANGKHEGAAGVVYKGKATVQGFNTAGEQIDVEVSG